MLRPAPNFQNIMARAGLRAVDIIRSAEISKSTYYGWLNPATQPHRRGGIGLVNAYKIAKVYAAAAQLDEEEAFRRIFVDVADQVAP